MDPSKHSTEGSVSIPSPKQDSLYNWPFPFPPYPIQKDFMENMYKTLDNGHIGIFESPTGTGKSLSIICSSLHWLLQNRTQSVSSAPPSKDTKPVKQETNNPSWIDEFVDKQKEQEQMYWARKKQLRQSKIENWKQKRKKKKKKTRIPIEMKENSQVSLNEFAPEDYNSSDCEKPISSDSFSDSDSDLSSMSDDDNGYKIRKIFFCSRTHSQLSQFMKEVKRTPFGKEITCVALGSRKQLCINSAVNTSFGNMTKMNEQCLDLHEKGKKSKSKNKNQTGTYFAGETLKPPSSSACPYYNKSGIKRFKDMILCEAEDIESLAKIGKDMETCAYYSARAAVNEAELIAIPYTTLLHKGTRESLGINIQGNIVICDEAHNLIDAINQTYGVEIENSTLTQAQSELEEYRKRYCSRLKAKNRLYVEHLVYVLRKLSKMIRTGKAKNKQDQFVTPGELMMNAQADHVNLFKLVKYIEGSNLIKKVRGFSQHVLHKNEVTIHKSPPQKKGKFSSCAESEPSTSARRKRSSLQGVYSFLMALTNAESNGKILILFGQEKLKYMMLNPAVHFRDIVDSAHSVILAGGTMQPVQDVITQLFSHLPQSSIHLFSCGHVIPKDNMKCICIGKGPTGKEIELTYEKRSQPNLLEEIGRALINICSIVPAGIVCFFASYAFEEECYLYWKSKGILNRITNKKQLFREPRIANQSEAVLAEYSACCTSSKNKTNGAVLLSVVGGKLSEGINFKDDMARCVVMVGLPFPNRHDPELKVRFNFLEQRNISSSEYYENICMKKVNQSIGRSIRHINDYSSIILLDKRYRNQNIVNKLPKWIADDMSIATTFGTAYRDLFQFFKHKKA